MARQTSSSPKLATIDPEAFERPSLSVVAVVDASGSMGWNYGGDNTSGAFSKALLTEVAQRLGEADREFTHQKLVKTCSLQPELQVCFDRREMHTAKNAPGCRPLRGLALALVCTFASPPAVAAQDAYYCIEDLSEEQLDYRIRRIQAHFDDTRQKASAWRYGWMFSIAGSLTLPIYELTTRSNLTSAQKFFHWGILAGGLVSVLQLAVIPAPAVWGSKRIRRKSSSTIEEQQAKLRYATRTLEKASNVEAYFGGVVYGGAGVVYGAVMGSVYVGLYHDDNAALPSKHDRVLARLRAAGLYLLPPALSVGQAMGRPMASYEYWEEYRGIACSSSYFAPPEPGPELDFGFGGMSFRVRLRF